MNQKILTKDISCERKCKSDGKKCNLNQWSNSKKCRCKCKKTHICEKEYIWNPSKCICENEKYLASIVDDSTIFCDEVIKSYGEEIKSIPSSFNEKKATCKTQSLYFLLVFLLIINIKNRSSYFFNDIISIKDFDPDNIKIDEKLYKNILIYYTGYVTIKKDLKLYSVNPLYLIFGNVSGYFEEFTGYKYLTLYVPTNESKEKIKKV